MKHICCQYYHNQIDIEYYTYDKKKQCNLNIMVYADKKDCLGGKFG